MIAFVAHHLALGAHEVRLYLDARHPELEAMLANIEPVSVVVCDAAYWRDKLGRPRPKSVERRQVMNAHHAYHTLDTEWLAHLDVDEFLHGDFPVSKVLAAQPTEVDAIKVLPRERAFIAGIPQSSLFEGVFRRPVPTQWGDAALLFGQGQKYQREGVLGHPQGKCIMRMGQQLLPGIHSPRRPKAHRHQRLHIWEAQRLRVLHFDGLTPLHWAAKLMRAAQAGWGTKAGDPEYVSGHRAWQVHQMEGQGQTWRRAMKMHDALKTLLPEQVERLRALGVIEDYHIQPDQNVAALGLDPIPDLSPASFDQAVMPLFAKVWDHWAVSGTHSAGRNAEADVQDGATTVPQLRRASL